MKYLRRSFLLAVVLIFSSIAASAQETGGVKGKIRTTRGNPIDGAIVTARQKGEDVKSVKADADGKFVLSGLPSGFYNIVFDKSGYSAGVKYNVEIKKNSTRDLGDRLVLTTDQGTQTIIRGSVFNQSDRSVGGAKVEIERISGDGSTRKVGSGYTNVSGEFTFRFPEGAAKYRVTATVKDAKASKEVEVTSAAIYRLAITLKVEKE
ncbi:MAG TPA: carboxypeptidase-like regulatory domain-containing protein [Pyrinomonadaceae bacterium]|nr:carboxypeptidase-like regulatory domain-containing protein [Pyrinomonadaceae bacterium]